MLRRVNGFTVLQSLSITTRIDKISITEVCGHHIRHQQTKWIRLLSLQYVGTLAMRAVCTYHVQRI